MDKRINQEIWKFSMDERKKEKSLEGIYQAAEKKQIRRVPSFIEKAWSQLRFQTWKYWTVQGGTLLLAMLLVYWQNRGQRDEIESMVFCSAFLVLAGNLCLSGIGRLFSWHMAELEQTLYLNLKQMVCIQMLAAGVVDMAILSIFAGINGRGSEAGVGLYLLYMVVPFLWADSLYLYMLTAMRRNFIGYKQLSSAVLCTITAVFIPLIWKNAYEAAYVHIWVLLCVGGILLLICQIKSMFGKIERGEELCRN